MISYLTFTVQKLYSKQVYNFVVLVFRVRRVICVYMSHWKKNIPGSWDAVIESGYYNVFFYDYVKHVLIWHEVD